jgi:hypothetical protein
MLFEAGSERYGEHHKHGILTGEKFAAHLLLPLQAWVRHLLGLGSLSGPYWS